MSAGGGLDKLQFLERAATATGGSSQVGGGRSAVAAASNSAIAAASGALGQSRSVSSGNRELQKLRHKCSNSLHFSAVVLANDFSNQVVDVLLFLCDPVNQWWDNSRTMRKTRKGAMQWRMELADGRFDEVIVLSVNRCFQSDLVQELMLAPATDADAMDDSSIEHEEALAALLLEVVMDMCRPTLMSMMTWAHRLPGYLVVLLDPSDDKVKGALSRLQAWRKYLCMLERWVKSLLHDLMWPSQPFVREALIMLYEAEFSYVSKELRDMVEGFAASVPTTNINEDLFNQYRQREHASMNDSLGRLARYHTASYCHLLADYGRCLRVLPGPSICFLGLPWRLVGLETCV